jgi:phosphopentomutase
MGKLGEGDVLVITADHGCDPGDASTDHTREYTPLLVLGEGVNPVNLGTRKTFADIAATAVEGFGISAKIAGESFYKDITEVRNE